MIDIKTLLAVGASLVAVAGNVPYIRTIGHNKVEPHPYTWGIDSLVTGTVFAGMVVKGAGAGAWPVGVSLLFTFSIFLYSLRYGVKHVTAFDTVLLVLILAGLVPWSLTQDPTWSVVIAVCVDIASFVPTVRKTWVHPSTEAPVLYGSNVARHSLVLAFLSVYNIATALHSVVMIALNIAMVGLILARKKRVKL